MIVSIFATLDKYKIKMYKYFEMIYSLGNNIHTYEKI